MRNRFGSGGGGIRTHEGFRPAGFQDRSHQPLDHPSGRLAGEVCHWWKVEQGGSSAPTLDEIGAAPVKGSSNRPRSGRSTFTALYVHVNLALCRRTKNRRNSSRSLRRLPRPRRRSMDGALRGTRRIDSRSYTWIWETKTSSRLTRPVRKRRSRAGKRSSFAT